MKNLTLSFEDIFKIERVLLNALSEKEFELSRTNNEPLKEFILKDIARNKEALYAFQAANAQNNYIL